MPSFPLVLVKIKKKKTLETRDVGEAVGETYIHYWWEGKLVQLL